MSNWPFALALSILAEVAGQLCFKRGALVPRAADSRLVRLPARWTLLGMACYAAELPLWIVVLSGAPLSLAFPLAASAYVFVAIASHWVFGERLTPRGWAAAGVVTFGAALVGSSGP